jgi:chromosomal replication initiation ATPase DnaA
VTTYQNDIFIEICNHYGVSIADVLGRSKKSEIALARHTIAYVFKYGFNMRYKQIARILDRHHSTIIHSVLTISETERIYRKSVYNYAVSLSEMIQSPLPSYWAIPSLKNDKR